MATQTKFEYFFINSLSFHSSKNSFSFSFKNNVISVHLSFLSQEITSKLHFQFEVQIIDSSLSFDFVKTSTLSQTIKAE